MMRADVRRDGTRVRGGHMGTRRSSGAHGVLVVMMAVAATGVLVRAAGLTTKYDAELQRLQGEWKAARQAEGLDPVRGGKALYGAYPTPELKLCKAAVVAPGASAPVTCTGSFGKRSVFLVEHDQVTLAPGASTATSYSATASVAADALPAFVRLSAYAPVSGAWSRRGVLVIGAAPAFSLTASNGWTIALTPETRKWTVDDDSASLAYRAEYTKPGAPAPFEKLTGTLTVSADDRPSNALTFSMQPAGTGGAMQEYQALVAKMADPAAFAKMSEKERTAFEKKMEDVGDRMTKEMEAMSANPAALIEKQAQFGCGTITLTIEGAKTSGHVSCGEKVGSLTLKGDRK